MKRFVAIVSCCSVLHFALPGKALLGHVRFRLDPFDAKGRGQPTGCGQSTGWAQHYHHHQEKIFRGTSGLESEHLRKLC